MNTEQKDLTEATTVEVISHGVEIVPAFRTYMDEQVAGLQKIWPRIDDAKVNLINERGIYSVEVTLVSGGLVTRGEVRADNSRVAFDAALDKIARQLRRYKKRALSRERRHDNRSEVEVVKPQVAEMNNMPFEDDMDEHYGTRVRTKRFPVKPMSPDEAALQMDLLGHNFFVFRDADTNEVSVVYKRRRGGYGLLEPIVD